MFFCGDGMGATLSRYDRYGGAFAGGLGGYGGILGALPSANLFGGGDPCAGGAAYSGMCSFLPTVSGIPFCASMACAPPSMQCPSPPIIQQVPCSVPVPQPCPVPVRECVPVPQPCPVPVPVPVPQVQLQ
ncbi:unnamed protein product [Rotaria sordida]|uniref:Uncharacterized protein n=1 Tax=Rotaria sordida TaxID=392033 RepID=A0A819JV96_9BILA|nr:unnamed protein product [Rotaria sordida]